MSSTVADGKRCRGAARSSWQSPKPADASVRPSNSIGRLLSENCIRDPITIFDRIAVVFDSKEASMWATRNLSEEDSLRLLDTEEDHFNDFKDKSNVGKCTKTISAFANADGGELFIGIRDSKEEERLSRLFVNPEEANGCITEIFSQFNDGPEYVDIEYVNCGGLGLCLHVTVQRTPFIVRSSEGKIFRRQNAQDREIRNAVDIHKLELEKGVRSFEDSTVEASIEEITNSSSADKFLNYVIPSTDLETFLKKERLLNQKLLRVCALLIFDDNPQSLLPHAGVKIYRYRTLAEEGDRDDLEGQPHTIEGSVYDVIYSAVKYTQDKIESIPLLREQGLVKVKYPAEAIHEVICNAVLHRDYSIHDYVHIRIFDNRIEVESPGRLAGAVTVSNILKQRFARNKKLVRLVAKFPSPPNKDVGEGLNTAFRSMQELNLGRPDIEETDLSVIVRLKHEPLASKEELIRQYLEKWGQINNKKARDICNVQSDSIIRKLFHAMISAGELEKVPDTRGTGTKYRLPKLETARS